MAIDYEHLKAIAEPYKPLISIGNIYTIHYFELSKDYRFQGESHDFWELVFVDCGELEVSADHKGYQLKEGDAIFHKPNEFHALWSNGVDAPNVLVISFNCNSEQMTFFENKIMKINYGERELLASIVREAKKVFNEGLGNLYLPEFRNDHPQVGAEQMMYIYLEEFLLRLIRDETIGISKERVSKTTKKKYEKSLVNEIIDFLNDNIGNQIYLEDICTQFYISNTHLKTVFKKETGYSVMKYFNMLKIEKAKQYIREKNKSFTQISQKLGFESVHYFSHCFKQITNLSPSEYASSIKALEEKMSPIDGRLNTPENSLKCNC